MMNIARLRTRALLLLTAAVLAGTTLSAAPASAEQVPPEWGDPDYQAGFMTVIGRQDGHLPDRLGNQHVTVASINDEDVLQGGTYDWRCPAGVTAPVDFNEPTACVLKGSYFIDFDYAAYAAGATYKVGWAPNLRYMNVRVPVVVTTYADGTVVRRGNLSVHIKATGALNLDVWDVGDSSTWLTRQDAHVVGGKFIGKPWLNMTSVGLRLDHDDEIALYSFYDGVPIP